MKKLTITAVFLSALLFLTGCGSSGSDDEQDPETIEDCVLGKSRIGSCKI